MEIEFGIIDFVLMRTSESIETLQIQLDVNTSFQEGERGRKYLLLQDTAGASKGEINKAAALLSWSLRSTECRNLGHFSCSFVLLGNVCV